MELRSPLCCSRHNALSAHPPPRPLAAAASGPVELATSMRKNAQSKLLLRRETPPPIRRALGPLEPALVGNTHLENAGRRKPHPEYFKECCLCDYTIYRSFSFLHTFCMIPARHVRTPSVGSSTSAALGRWLAMRCAQSAILQYLCI